MIQLERVRESPWTGDLEWFEPLRSNALADVCVVGGGIAGMTTAYLLARAGQDVIVLDDGPIGGGQTRLTSAHLSNAIDDRYREVERIRGEGVARLAAESHTAAIDTIESIVREEDIDCGFERVDGYLFLPPGRPMDDLAEELNAARRAGLAVERIARAPVAFDTGPCIRFPRQAQFDPLRYLGAITRTFARLGGRMHCATRVDSIRSGETCTVQTVRGPSVQAAAVVVATNVPFHDRFAIHTKQAAYVTYAIAANVPDDVVAPVLLWDDADPYHYVRFQPALHAGEESHLIVGGEDHRSGQEDGRGRHERLEQWARARCAHLGEVTHRWVGQVMETLDGLAFIGPDPTGSENVYVATGDSGMGLTHGTIAGLLLTDLVLGRKNEWADVYDPARKPVAASGRYVRENLRTLRGYAEWLPHGDAPRAEELSPGQGAVVRHGLTPVATYRDRTGTLHEMSAVCPHLGCIVTWNGVRRGFDCPCHGSRFDPRGRLTNGPANRDLAHYEHSPDEPNGEPESPGPEKQPWESPQRRPFETPPVPPASPGSPSTPPDRPPDMPPSRGL